MAREPAQGGSGALGNRVRAAQQAPFRAVRLSGPGTGPVTTTMLAAMPILRKGRSFGHAGKAALGGCRHWSLSNRSCPGPGFGDHLPAAGNGALAQPFFTSAAKECSGPGKLRARTSAA